MIPYQFKKTPFKHQLEALEKGRDREFFAYLMEMRTGKSKVLMDEAAQLWREGKIDGLVIVTMATLCPMWKNEQLPTHMPLDVPLRVCLWQHNNKTFAREVELLMKPVKKLDVLIMNIEAVRTDRGYDALLGFLKSHKAMVGVDESIIIKGDSQQTKILTRLCKQHSKYRRILNGTPAPERPLDVYYQFNFLKEGCLGHTSFYSFKNRYTVTRDRYVNGRKFKEIVGYQRVDELQKKIAEHSYRKLRRECFDIAENRYNTKVLLSAKQQKFYNELRDDTLTFLDSGELVAAELVITRLTRLRQALCNIAVTTEKQIRMIDDEENPRMDALLATLEEAGEKKVIIWSYFTPSIINITETLNKKLRSGSAAFMYGEVKAKDRDELRVKFQDMTSDLQYLVIQPGIGGFGLDLTASDTMIYNDHDYSRLKREQSETRVLGPMQKSELITYVNLVAENTMDVTLLDVQAGKKDLSDQVTGDNLRQLLGG